MHSLQRRIPNRHTIYNKDSSPRGIMAFVRRLQIILRHAILLFIFALVADAQIYRNKCRRDAIMKVTDRDKKLTGVIFQVRASALPHCVRGCINESMCSSINYKKVTTTTQGTNCELLNTNRTSEGANLIAAPGWLHYEPTAQVCTRVHFSFYILIAEH